MKIGVYEVDKDTALQTVNAVKKDNKLFLDEYLTMGAVLLKVVPVDMMNIPIYDEDEQKEFILKYC